MNSNAFKKLFYFTFWFIFFAVVLISSLSVADVVCLHLSQFFFLQKHCVFSLLYIPKVKWKRNKIKFLWPPSFPLEKKMKLKCVINMRKIFWWISRKGGCKLQKNASYWLSFSICSVVDCFPATINHFEGQ